MPRRLPRLPWLALPLACVLYLWGITAAGLLGPDEPRYAAIAREMAYSGDWTTPRLWGAPWFEKPALLYWMSGAAFKFGLGPDLAPRLPVALASLGFLVFFWFTLRREFGCVAAWISAMILATSAGWCLYSDSCVTDIPLSITFGAAMLLALPWIKERETRPLPLAACFFGLAVLAKGPVALVLAAPLALRWRNLADWFRPLTILLFVLFAAPWYLLCYLQNGGVFLQEFLWKHNIGRFTTTELQHVQPWWYFLPALAVLFVPWTPALFPAFRDWRAEDPRRRFLLLWGLWPIVFFSLSVNKLAGYILPALPAFAALAGIALAEARKAGAWLAACALMAVALFIAAPLVDIGGITRGAHPQFQPIWLAPVPFAIAAWLLDSSNRRLAAAACVAFAAAAGLLYLKFEAGSKPFTRELWAQTAPHAVETCIGHLDRSWRYGLNYYSGTPLPDCATQPRPWRIDQTGSAMPTLNPVDPH
jgi:4-amino-4-deoxy-L-arabinose transferase-like glycosyltransferase